MLQGRLSKIFFYKRVTFNIQNSGERTNEITATTNKVLLGLSRTIFTAGIGSPTGRIKMGGRQNN